MQIDTREIERMYVLEPRGEIDIYNADILKNRIYTYNHLQSVPSPNVKKKTSGNKPAWMK